MLQAGFFFGVNQLNILALNHLDASIFTILQSFRIVIVTILGAILLKDQPTLLEMVGGGFIFTSILVLKLHKDKQYFSKPVLLGIVATVFMSLNVIAEKNLLNKTTVVTEMFWTSLITIPVLLMVIGFQKDSWRKSLPHIKNTHSLALALLRPSSAWLYSIAVALGSVAVTNYVSSLSVVFVVAFGIIFLKERDHIKQKLLALLFAFIGLTVIFISRI